MSDLGLVSRKALKVTHVSLSIWKGLGLEVLPLLDTSSSRVTARDMVVEMVQEMLVVSLELRWALTMALNMATELA